MKPRGCSMCGPPGSHKFAHASFGPDGAAGPEALRLLYDKTWGRRFDEGFHRDASGGSVPLSMLSVFLKAKIAVAEAELCRNLGDDV